MTAWIPGRRPGLVLPPDPDQKEVVESVAILGRLLQGGYLDQQSSLQDSVSFQDNINGGTTGQTGSTSRNGLEEGAVSCDMHLG
jgi:hypothetical protein